MSGAVLGFERFGMPGGVRDRACPRKGGENAPSEWSWWDQRHRTRRDWESRG